MFYELIWSIRKIYKLTYLVSACPIFYLGRALLSQILIMVEKIFLQVCPRVRAEDRSDMHMAEGNAPNIGHDLIHDK